MSKTWVILINELKSTLKRKGFFITTLAVPLLGLLGILGYQVVQNVVQPSSDVSKIGYVDQSGLFAGSDTQGKIEFAQYPSPEAAADDLLKGEIEEYFLIPQDYLTTGLLTMYTLKREVEPPRDVVVAGNRFLVANLLKDKVSPEVIARIHAPASVATVVMDKSTGAPAEEQAGLGSLLIAYLFAILLLTSMFTASGYLLQGLSEEKENRIMEVLLSSVSTRQLITGKVLGLGIAGLLQMAFWLLSAWGLLSLASISIGGFFASLEFPMGVLVLSLVYFVLGYFLYAILMAGVGAVVPTVRDGQQLSMIITILGAVPFVLMAYIIENGDTPLNIALTLFPPTAPLTVMMRLGAGIPTWEFGVNIALLLGSIVGCLFLASRVFRAYLLMYGKTPGARQILRTIRQT